MKGVNIFLADGFEDVEALATNDVLRRGGIDVNIISIYDETSVESSHGITVEADQILENVNLGAAGTTQADVMIFPGGMPGTRNLAACEPLMEAMKAHYAAGGTVAAICAAPGLVISQLGDALKGKEVTCFDGFEANLEAEGAVFVPRPAVRSGRVITGRSAGHAVSFALEILGLLAPEKVEQVRHAMYLKTI
ncbi:MAG: DJ-1/PfpI family protein [Bacteroidales bacterium]|nr:DJ-1/PfpI family protein [Bacteroidales bacterium]